jgi:hypothetical protein
MNRKLLRPTEFYLVSGASAAFSGGEGVVFGGATGHLVLEQRIRLPPRRDSATGKVLPFDFNRFSKSRFKLPYTVVGAGVGISALPYNLDVSTEWMTSVALGEVCLLPAFSGSEMPVFDLAGPCVMCCCSAGIAKQGGVTFVFFNVPRRDLTFLFADAVGIMYSASLGSTIGFGATAYSGEIGRPESIGT